MKEITKVIERHEGERLRAFVMVRQALRLSSLLLLLLPGRSHAETIDRVLAVVAGQVITLSDVTAARDLGLQTADAGGDPIRAVLSKLIDRELVMAEVDRYGPPEPAPEAIDREVERVRARFASPAAFDAALRRSGIDEKHLRETLRQDLRAAAYLGQRFPRADARRAPAIDEWMTGLRRRADVIDLYLAR